MKVKIINPFNKTGSLLLVKDGLKDVNGTIIFQRIKGAYRVLENANNYTNNFGFQWNKFQKTQIDRESKSSSQSKDRFFAVTNWDKEDLTNKNVLEVGSGAGRFSQILLDNTKANLYSVDYSNAVEANFRNNGHHKNRFHLFQASVYEMPFEKENFDKVFCFGVLQHTPDFEKSIKTLVEMVKPGGELIVDFYPIKGLQTKIHAKYLLRPFTKKMSHKKLLKLIERNIKWMIKTTQFFSKIGLGLLNRFIPICGIGLLPKNLTKEELREWCILDTFDMFSPEYDQPQRLKTVVKWVKKYGITNAKGYFIRTSEKNGVVCVKGIK